MKTKTLASLLAIVSMLMIVAVSWMPSACAWETEGTETINEDEYWYQTIEFFNGDYFTLSYTITVQNDQYIDVILVNEENFNLYKNGYTFTYYAEGTDFDTLYTDVPSITFYTHDNYYLVVDNTDKGGAKPAWDGVNNYCTFHYVSSGNAYTNPPPGTNGNDDYDEGSDESFGVLGILCVSVTGIIIIIVVAVGFALHGKQQKQRAQQQQQPAQPYYRNQQPPPPPDYRPPQ